MWVGASEEEGQDYDLLNITIMLNEVNSINVLMKLNLKKALRLITCKICFRINSLSYKVYSIATLLSIDHWLLYYSLLNSTVRLNVKCD